MPKAPPFLLLLLLLTLLRALPPSTSEPYLGVNYGELADNLPPPSATARLLQSSVFSHLRLYTPDPALISSLAGTPISLLVGVPNSDIPSLAGDPSAASAWISSNLLPFLPSASISAVAVGNELLTSGDASLASLLLPAMQNLRAAIAAAPAAAGVKVSTVHSMAVLSQSDPPSAGAFHGDLAGVMQPVLQFLRDGDSPFMINPYPYFAYRSDPRPETLAFCLFQPGSARLDPASGIAYANMFDAQVSGVKLERNELKPELADGFLDEWNAENVEKLKKYEAAYARRLKAIYFSKKNLNGVDIFDHETRVENMIIKSSRWPCTRSFADPIQNMEDQNGFPSSTEAETTTLPTRQESSI